MIVSIVSLFFLYCSYSIFISSNGLSYFILAMKRNFFYIFEELFKIMIHYEKFILSNGLRVLVHTDIASPLVAMNILYDVGSRDESPDRTGFAHLFEHLMFGGSINIPRYDEPLEKVGGENNAFTSADITNYYLTLPSKNLETAFWLESDRMLSLAFSEKSLEVQRNIVMEEYKQRYQNKPYGDVWLLLKPLAYKFHPYRWPTIGQKMEHVETASLQDVKDFFKKFYHPGNAILTLSGDISLETAKDLCEKWFAPIPACTPYVRNLPIEPLQTAARSLSVERDVPFDAFYRAYPMCNRLHKDYYACDIISGVLSEGQSSRLNQRLVRELQLFSDINAYLSGDIDEGLFVFSGRLREGVDMKIAEEAIDKEIHTLIHEGVTEIELTKIVNKVESIQVMAEMNITEKAMNLAYWELLGDPSRVNTEIEFYKACTVSDIQNTAAALFKPEKSNTLYYFSSGTL